MDPAANVVKRTVLAQHLREVLDTLESKADQITALYDALKLRKGADQIFQRVRDEYEPDAKPVKGKGKASLI